MSFPAIHKTVTIITEIENKVYHRDLRQRLKVLLKCVQDSIKEIETYLQIPEYNSYKNKVKLCISQMLKVIPAVIHLLSEGNHSAFEDVAEYMLEKLKWCLMEPMRMFGGGGVEEDTEASGIFVRSIDWAISALQAAEPIDSNYKLAIDDLLCQALTIAKLSAGQDYQEISSGCRSVLVSLSSTMDNKETMESARRLHRDILLCNLETLYRRVNTAVLRLFLYVMSDSFLPLKNIIIKCVESFKDKNQQKKKQPSDLGPFISKLDLYLEQIHLLGNFAVACTDSWEMKLRLQCSLASLEFCETHLVPAITAFYMDQQLNKRDYLSFLTDEAQKAFKDLHLQIDNIVDTGSFARVVFEDLTDVTRTIRENVSDDLFEKRECELFQRRCNKLVQHLLTTDDKYVRQDPSVHQIVKQLLTVLKNQSDHLRSGSPIVNHVLWDLDFALELLDRLCQKLNFSTLNHSTIGRISIDRSVSFPNSVRSLPLEVSTTRSDKNVNITSREGGQTWLRRNFLNSPNMEDSDRPEAVSSTLEPYLSRVGDTPMIKSTLYCRTPLKTPRSLRTECTSYDFTDILQEIAKLPNDSWIPFNEDPSQAGDSTFINNNNKDNFNTAGDDKSTLFSSCAPLKPAESYATLASDMYAFESTTDRLRDIIIVEEKIKNLKDS